MSRFYNSITLLGEFYNRLHQKSHPVLIIGRSLFELLSKELKSECAKCTNDPMHVFSVQFARLLLTQVSANILSTMECILSWFGVYKPIKMPSIVYTHPVQLNAD